MLDEDHVVTCSRDPIIKIFDLSTSKSLTELKGHEMAVSTIAFNQESNANGGKVFGKLASAGRDY